MGSVYWEPDCPLKGGTSRTHRLTVTLSRLDTYPWINITIPSKGCGLKSEDDVLTKSLLVKFVAMSDQIELDELAGAPSSSSSRLLALFRARPSPRSGIPRQPLPMSLCEECGKASRNGSVSGVLHSNLDKILSCASECAFCAYLCDLVGREKLSQAQREIISSGHSQIYLSRNERVELNQKLHFWWSHHHRDAFGGNATFVTKELTVCGETCGVAQLSAAKHERSARWNIELTGTLIQGARSRGPSGHLRSLFLSRRGCRLSWNGTAIAERITPSVSRLCRQLRALVQRASSIYGV
jgi:hypothetical protein